MVDPKKSPFHRLSAALSQKDWDQVDAELARFTKFMGKQVMKPNLDPMERVAVFGLGLLTAAARRALPPPNKWKKKP